jgi:hypothetical protein
MASNKNINENKEPKIDKINLNEMDPENIEDFEKSKNHRLK